MGYILARSLKGIGKGLFHAQLYGQLQIRHFGNCYFFTCNGSEMTANQQQQQQQQQQQVHKIVLLGDKASGKSSLARRWTFNENTKHQRQKSNNRGIGDGEDNDTADGRSSVSASVTASASMPSMPLVSSGSYSSASGAVASSLNAGFSQVYRPTVGLDIYEKTVIINYDPTKSRPSQLFPQPKQQQQQQQGSNQPSAELQVKIQVWDVSGDLIHDEYLLAYILYGCSAVLFCYDISSFLMFQDLAQIWYPAVMRLYVPLIPPGREITATARVRGNNGGGGGNAASNVTKSNMNLAAGSTMSLAAGGASGSMVSLFGAPPGGRSNNLRGSNILGNSRASFASLTVPATGASQAILTMMKSNVALGGRKGDPESNDSSSSSIGKTSKLTTTKPYFALIGTKNDLAYSRAVKLETHHRYAYEQNMYTYFVSAKTGEKVQNCFFHVACDLAGVVPKTDPLLKNDDNRIARPTAAAAAVSAASQQQNADNMGKDPSKKECIIQ